MAEQSTFVNFIAKGSSPNEWKMVLVEEGPWQDVSAELRRVQLRLYGCIDAALDGTLAKEFPESNGKKIVIQLDGYNIPKDEVTEFFGRFSKGVFVTPEYGRALKRSPFVKSISFELNFDSVN